MFESIKYYLEWNKPAFIVYLIMAGVAVALTAASLVAGFGDVDACKTRCGR